MSLVATLGKNVEMARTRLDGVIAKTPTVFSSRLDGWLKLESLQHTGAYKIRGAYNAMASAVERGDRRGVIAASAGNHASGVACAAQKLGLEAWTVVPTYAPLSKLQITSGYGARVVVHGDSFEESWAHALELAEERGLRFVHPFDDPDVIAGQGTVGLELREMDPDVVLVPVGGGGLASGVALAMRNTRTRVVGVQVLGVDAMNRALHGVAPLTRTARTVADGVRVKRVGKLTQELCSALLDDIVVVREDEVERAVVELARFEGLVAEGAGALAAAAMKKVSGDRKVAVLSGGNIDLQDFAELVSRVDCASPLCAYRSASTVPPATQGAVHH